MRSSPLLVGVALLGAVTVVLLGLTLGRLGTLEERVASTEASVGAITTITIDDLETRLDDLRASFAEELATIRFRGVVPTDSSSVILDRLDALRGAVDRIDEMAATLDRLEGRLDQICEGIPVC